MSANVAKGDSFYNLSKNRAEANAFRAVGSGDREALGVGAKARVRGEESKNEWLLKVEWLSHAVVFGALDGLGIEKIEPHRILFKFGLIEKPGPQGDPFLLPDLTFEDGFLDTEAVVGAGTGDPAEAAGSAIVGSGDVVGDKDKHLISESEGCILPRLHAGREREAGLGRKNSWQWQPAGRASDG